MGLAKPIDFGAVAAAPWFGLPRFAARAAPVAGARSMPHERQEAFVRFARTGDEAVYLATVSPPAAATPEREAGNLPRPLTRLVGRERDVAAVRDLLAAAYALSAHGAMVRGELLSLTRAGRG